jgi:aromatic amino acid aminotransferase I
MTTYTQGDDTKPLIDFTYHLSETAKRRLPSPLKDMQRYFGRPGQVMLVGGLPDPEYFPFETLSAKVLTPTTYSTSLTLSVDSRRSFSARPLSWLWGLLGLKGPTTEEISVPKYAPPGGPSDAIQLATTLQYGVSRALPALANFIQSFTLKVYRPFHPSRTVTLIDVGSTDGWVRACMMLCNEGEGVLAEEWTYASALAASWPLGIKAIPVPIDGDGMRPEKLEEILANWDEAKSGMKRPHVMYTIPVGQNPTGSTMQADRKKQIYAICVKYDIIIVEDDPYYFLQFKDYVPSYDRQSHIADTRYVDDNDTFLSSLVPSFLRFDYQGRVIRLDSFSKTIAPGCRMGWFTCNSMFAERLERHGETTTQSPSGFVQSLVAELIAHQWKFSGYVRWLRGLRTDYTHRRNTMLDAFADQFELTRGMDTSFPLTTGALVFFGRQKRVWGLDEKKQDKVLISFYPPRGGMFIWVKVHFYNHPRFSTDLKKDNTEKLEIELWTALAEGNCVTAPGWFFNAHRLGSQTDDPSKHELVPSMYDAETLAAMRGYGHYRISFSLGDLDTLKRGINLFGTVTKKFFNDG